MHTHLAELEDAVHVLEHDDVTRQAAAGRRGRRGARAGDEGRLRGRRMVWRGRRRRQSSSATEAGREAAAAAEAAAAEAAAATEAPAPPPSAGRRSAWPGPGARRAEVDGRRDDELLAGRSRRTRIWVELSPTTPVVTGVTTSLPLRPTVTVLCPPLRVIAEVGTRDGARGLGDDHRGRGAHAGLELAVGLVERERDVIAGDRAARGSQQADVSDVRGELDVGEGRDGRRWPAARPATLPMSASVSGTTSSIEDRLTISTSGELELELEPEGCG